MNNAKSPEEIAQERIAAAAEQRAESLDLGRLGLRRLPDTLFELTHLRQLNLGNGLLGKDGAIHYLPGMSNILAAGLDQLAALNGLTWLCIDHTGCKTLAPFKGLTALIWLSCVANPLRDLTPLAGHTGLQTLRCNGTQVEDLTPLAGMTALRTLRCNGTRVNDLAPLAGLKALRTLDCGGTQVNSLAPLAGLSALQTLRCDGTEVSDLAPLAGLNRLQSLHCRGTQVESLAPLAGLNALRTLDCDNTQVSDLAPLARLNRLEDLGASNLVLRPGQEPVWRIPSLRRLMLRGTRIPGIPAEVLSQHSNDNCLASLRAHLDNIAAGATPLRDVKLFILGNGRAGKTQLTRRLRRRPDEPFQDEWYSTHGVQVTTATIPGEGGTPDTPLRVWDFGGQDIYHGTHALFARSNAMFLILWSKDTDDTREYEDRGVKFRNHRLAYWCDYVRHAREGTAPVLVVQNKCETAKDEIRPVPVPAASLTALGAYRELHYSSKSDRRRGELDAALRGAFADLREETGDISIGTARLAVLRGLETMRDQDNIRAISVEDFDALYRKEGALGEPNLFLGNLHNAGIVFHKPGLFADQVILDQQWALDAIYAVMERDKALRQLRAREGKFFRQDLADWVWDARRFTAAEQRLFLSMMEQCGICFALRRDDRDEDRTEYLAPDLAPERAQISTRLAAAWDDTAPPSEAAFAYDFLHPGLIRSLIAWIGAQAGMEAIYWRGGVQAFESHTKSRVRIEQHIALGVWHGTIRVETVGPQANALRDRVAAWIEAENEGHGLTATRSGAAPHPSRIEPPEQGLDFKPGRKAPVEYCVSYAWNDASPGGPAREAVVDRLCQEADLRGTPVLRDKTQMGLGDRISTWMERIAMADRVFVILSDKYLRSEYCMTELLWVWKRSSGWLREESRFLKCIRVFVHDDARFQRPEDIQTLREYWTERYISLKARMERTDFDRISVPEFRDLKTMGEIRDHIGDLLKPIAGTLHARSFEDLRKYGFDDPPGA